ncbi:MAG: hypothetical protein KKF44_06930 [Nanoarchaeota archaeon]|nr:hypothetical protein [Nanoarchaeota archaeon]
MGYGDPFTARIVTSALLGIGIAFFIGRNAGKEHYVQMLNLKLIWSTAAMIGIGLTLIEGSNGRPLFAYVFLFLFVAFNVLWFYWRKRLSK